MKPCVLLTNSVSVSRKCDRRIKINGAYLREDKLKINCGGEERKQAKSVVAYRENLEKVKDMFRKVKRQASKAKRQVTNIYINQSSSRQ